MYQLLNDILNKVFLSVESEGLNLLEKIGIISEDMFNIQPLKFIFEKESEQIIHSLTLFLLFIFIVFLLLKNIFSRKDNLLFNFKLSIKIIVIGIICINSYSICRDIIRINFIITEQIKEIFEYVADEKIEYTSLKENIENLDEYIKIQDKIGIKGIKDIIFTSLIILLIIAFSIIYVVIILGIILSPLFIIFSLYEKTQNIFIFWVKFFITGLLIQNLNIIILFICISAKAEKELYSCILLGSVMLLYRINKKVGEI